MRTLSDLEHLPADSQAILNEFGSEKATVIKYLYWVRNVLGYKKRHLLQELDGLLDQHKLIKNPGLAGSKLPADIEGVLGKIGQDKGEELYTLVRGMDAPGSLAKIYAILAGTPLPQRG